MKALHMVLVAILFIGCSDDDTASTADGGTSQSFVKQSTGKTNSSGEVTLNDKTFAVKSESSKKPLTDIVVHHFFDGSSGLAIAVDGSKKHYPDFVQFGTGNSPTSTNGGIGTATYALIDETIFLKDTTKDVLSEVANIAHGSFLGQDKNFNKYCMTMEQIRTTSVSVPLGLVLIAAKAAGVKTKVLKNAGNKLLGSALEAYIVAEHGVQSAYEVWVPKTAVSLCGQKYTGVTCSLTQNDLKKIWDPNKPIWMVKGACVYTGPKPPKGDVWIDPSTGFKWQVQPTGDDMDWWKSKTHCENLTLAGKSDWRMPTISELRSLIKLCVKTKTGGSCKVTDSCLSKKACAQNNGCTCPQVYDKEPSKGGKPENIYWPTELNYVQPSLNSIYDKIFWSSSINADDPNEAWRLDTIFASLSPMNKKYKTASVRCMR